MKGLEEFDDIIPLGDYLQQQPDGRILLLRGKYRGAYLDTIPRGYIRKYILKAWLDGMTPVELELFTHYGKKDEEVTDVGPNHERVRNGSENGTGGSTPDEGAGVEQDPGQTAPTGNADRADR